MGLSCSENVLRIVFFVFNILLGLCGLVIIITGSLAYKNVKEVKEIDDQALKSIENIAIGINVLGVVVFLLGFLGCTGALLKIRYMLLGFVIILVIVLLAEIGLGIAADTTDEIQNETVKLLDDSMPLYNGDTEIKKFWDNYQQDNKCCGTTGPASWDAAKSENGKKSCCIKEGCDIYAVEADDSLFSQGCLGLIKGNLKHYMHVMWTCLIVFGLLQALSICAAIVLYRAMKYNYYSEV